MNEKVNKPVVFHRGDKSDMELYEWLQTRLKKGDFTTDTKAYWMDRMKRGKKFERESDNNEGI